LNAIFIIFCTLSVCPIVCLSVSYILAFLCCGFRRITAGEWDPEWNYCLRSIKVAVELATLRIRQVGRVPSKVTYYQNHTNYCRSQAIPWNITCKIEISSVCGYPVPIKYVLLLRPLTGILMR